MMKHIQATHFLYTNSMEEEAPLTGQGGRSESKDEMKFAFLDTPILLDETTRADSWTDYAGCTPDNDRTQSLHDVRRTPHKTTDRANFDLVETFISPDQEIKLKSFRSIPGHLHVFQRST
uniref:Uncharacterized protein n=1 Tax=Arundo donax TaxID=35708 RepID=A0A0A8Y126_ARUDO